MGSNSEKSIVAIAIYCTENYFTYWVHQYHYCLLYLAFYFSFFWKSLTPCPGDKVNYKFSEIWIIFTIFYILCFLPSMIHSLKNPVQVPKQNYYYLLLLPPKYEIIMVPSNHSFLQYCDCNIGLFSIAPWLPLLLAKAFKSVK